MVPAVAANRDGFLVVWQRDESGVSTPQVFTHHLDYNGGEIGDPDVPS